MFLNGHYDNTYAIAYACATAAANGLPDGVRAFPINYWDGITPEEAAEFFGLATGLHANRGETSAVMAINPALVDIDNANAEMPPFPEVTNTAARAHRVLLLEPGLGLPRDQVGLVGRRARRDGRVRRALPVGHDRVDRCGCSTTSSARSRQCPRASYQRLGAVDCRADRARPDPELGRDDLDLVEVRHRGRGARSSSASEPRTGPAPRRGRRRSRRGRA